MTITQRRELELYLPVRLVDIIQSFVYHPGMYLVLVQLTIVEFDDVGASARRMRMLARMLARSIRLLRQRMKRHCSVCGDWAARRCACLSIRYCSMRCQLAGRASHKDTCRALLDNALD
jgi:hypothetical protein